MSLHEHPTLPFAPHKLARAENPETSKAAARASKELRGWQHRAILRALVATRSPMSACDVAEWLRNDAASVAIDKVQIGRRLHELQAHGYLEVADEDGVTDTGRKARRYRLAKAVGS